MLIRQCVVAVCILNLFASSVEAASPSAVIAQVQAQLSSDSALLSGWMVNQTRYVVPFNSTAGNVVPSQLKLFGFEVGVEGVASGTKVDTSALHSLPTTLVKTQSIDSFSRFPFPMVLGHAKIGLPFGLDAGVRYGGIPKTNINNGKNTASISNKVFGLDLRKKIIEEGMVKPFGLTLGVDYTHADGSFNLTAPFDPLATTISSNGNTYTARVNNGSSTNNENWNTNSYGVQAILDKQILFFTPYVGASANYNTGSVNNAITTTGTPMVTDQNSISQGADAPIAVTGGASAKAVKWDARLLLGAEFSVLPFLRLGIGGEYAGSKNVAGSLGLRFQFR